MRKFLRFKTVAIIAAVNFSALCLLADYRFDRVRSFNWDISLMLTPYGIVKNLLIENQHYLAPYYFKEIQLPPEHQFFPFIFLVFMQVALSLATLYFYKKESC